MTTAAAASPGAGQTVKPTSSVHFAFRPHSLLRVDAGVLAVGFSLEVVGVALTASVPELGTSIGLRVVVPPDFVLSTGTRVQWLAAPLI